MQKFLESTDIVDWSDRGVAGKALLLAHGAGAGSVDVARRCFEFVRDKIRHSFDHRLNPVTLKASEVMLHRTGTSFSKSHLLAALLRASGIPAGFCYQRLSLDGTGALFALHGIVAAHLPGFGWYRMDAWGNPERVDGRFTPPDERIIRTPRFPGEIDLPEIWPEPLDIVVKALRANKTWSDLQNNLPDVTPFPALLPVRAVPNPFPSEHEPRSAAVTYDLKF